MITEDKQTRNAKHPIWISTPVPLRWRILLGGLWQPPSMPIGRYEGRTNKPACEVSYLPHTQSRPWSQEDAAYPRSRVPHLPLEPPLVGLELDLIGKIRNLIFLILIYGDPRSNWALHQSARQQRNNTESYWGTPVEARACL